MMVGSDLSGKNAAINFANEKRHWGIDQFTHDRAVTWLQYLATVQAGASKLRKYWQTRGWGKRGDLYGASEITIQHSIRRLE
jgi:hypothetical protein